VTWHECPVWIHESSVEIVSCNLCVIQCRQDRQNHIIMGEVKVKWLIKKICGRSIQSGVLESDIGQIKSRFGHPVQEIEMGEESVTGSILGERIRRIDRSCFYDACASAHCACDPDCYIGQSTIMTRCAKIARSRWASRVCPLSRSYKTLYW
jgi:hypothetical protein